MGPRTLAIALALATLAGCNCGSSATDGGSGGGVSGAGGGSGSDGGCPAEVPTCLGVCAATPPLCVDGGWTCTGPGFQSPETSCDGFDNNCDGVTDEGCPACTVNLEVVRQNLYSEWDIDFDSQCTTLLTTLVSGADSVTVVPADGGGGPVATYLGNANQNMGYALVDTDPANPRVVVAYSCCLACNCLAKNGLTLLYTCDAGAPGCGCAGNSHCPGFLDAPFLTSSPEDTSVTAGRVTISTPTGLAAGPGSHYYVGNWRPETCLAADAGCTACDPAHPAATCSPSRPACCDASALGRLAEFTLPEPGREPTFRVVAIYPGEELLNLASTAAGEVLVATKAPGGGALHRYTPARGRSVLVASFPAPVYSVVEDHSHGDVYLQLLSGAIGLQRLGPDGGALPLPDGVPAGAGTNGVLQFGPDHQLYRLVGVANGTSVLDVYPVP
jgi:hypothetical protein